MRRSLIQKVFGTLNRLFELTGAGSAIVTVLALFIVSFDVVMRFAVRHPTPWGNEIASHLLLVIVSLAIVYALVHNRHITADVVYVRLSQKVKTRADIATLSLSLAFCAVGVWKSVQVTLQAFRGGWTWMPLLIVPLWLTYGIVTLCLFALCLELLLKIRECWIPAGAKNAPSADGKEK